MNENFFRKLFGRPSRAQRRKQGKQNKPAAPKLEVTLLEDRVVPALAFSEFVDPNPSSGNGFGSTVVPLSTGNVVITAPYDDAGGVDAGAVYLFSGATGKLISTLIGSHAYDNVGSGGVVALSNGNYVVSSSNWDNGGIVDAGAATWGNGSSGVVGAVSSSNSLVGTQAGDYVGSGSGGVVALSNGNYVVRSSNWDNGGIVNAGAVTWGNGSSGVVGAVSSSNSLVGTQANGNLQPVRRDDVNQTYIAPFWGEGRVRVASQAGASGGNNSSLFPVVEIVPNPASVVEGNAITFTVQLAGSQTGDQDIVVTYSTVDGNAVAPGDYTPVVNGTVTIAAGTTSATFTVATQDDGLNEAAETFQVRLVSATNATLSTTANQATGTITDNDPLPTLSVGNASATETPGGSSATFTVTLSGPSGQVVTVNYATSNGTATAGSDYGAVKGKLTFAPGETTKTVSVPVMDDGIYDPNETFFVTLSGATNATIATGTGTITDDEAAPVVSVGDVSVAEGNSGTTAMTFTVSLDRASSETITVVLNTVDGTATAGTDYTAIAGQVVTFLPGETVQTVTVNILGDTRFEADETFTVKLSNPVSATLGGTGAATGTIRNDDARPMITVTPVNQVVGEGAGTATFTVTLSNASDEVVQVDYATANGSALAGLDYTATSGTLTFNPDDPLTQTITVAITEDNLAESDESFVLTLSNPVNGTLANVQGTVTITDNDAAPTITLSPVTVTQAEGNSGPVGVTFTVTLSNPSSQIVTVNYATADGMATAGSDYTAVSGTLIFLPGGALSQTITVFITGDTTFEPNESFSLTLSNPVNGILGAATATTTITNDDPVPTLAVSNVTADEGNSGTTPFTFTVLIRRLSGLFVQWDGER